MTNDIVIDGLTYRIVRDGSLWRIAFIDNACSRWLRLKSGRARYWKRSAGAEKFLDGLRRIRDKRIAKGRRI